MITYDTDGILIEVKSYLYDVAGRVLEIDARKQESTKSWKLNFSFSTNYDTVNCLSNYTTYFVNNRIVRKYNPHQDIYFVYNSLSEMIQELYVPTGSSDTGKLSYSWENDNIISTKFLSPSVGNASFKYDNSKPFMIGDVFYIYFLERFGRVPFKRNVNQCINEVVNANPPLSAGNDVVYNYDNKGRISGYTISNNGGSVKYIYR